MTVDPSPDATSPDTTSFDTSSPANRFLLVSVAARRAAQLRRGARPRLAESQLARMRAADPERVALEEVRRGLVEYALTDPTAASNGATAVDSTAAPELEQEVSGALERHASRAEVVVRDEVDQVDTPAIDLVPSST